MKRKMVLVMLVLATAVAAYAEGLPAPVQEQLAASKYVYIATQRKDGSFSKPAEIWFLFHKGAVWVASPPTTWRVRRIKAGRTAAKIIVGKPDGASFEAKGEIVKDPEVNTVLLETYAKKYPEGWSKFESKFREGFRDGSRVLIKYTPK